MLWFPGRRGGGWGRCAANVDFKLRMASATPYLRSFRTALFLKPAVFLFLTLILVLGELALQIDWNWIAQNSSGPETDVSVAAQRFDIFLCKIEAS